MRANLRTRLCCTLALALCFAACGDDGPSDTPDAAAADGGKRAGTGGAGAGVGGSAGRSGSGGRSGAGAGGRGGNTAGRSASDDDGGTAYPSEAGPKGPAGTVRGWIRGFESADASHAVVSAGGVQVGPTATGHFVARGVPVGSAVSIFVRAVGYSTAHALVPVREGEVTPILLDVTKLAIETIGDPAAAHESTFGQGDVKHSLSWSAAALQTVYGTPPSGAVQFQSADLGARLAPAGLSTRGSSGPRALRAFAVVELRLLQPRAALVLTKPATLTFRLPDIGAATPSLYRFDERSGLFEPVTGGTFDATAQTLSATVDRLGIFAAAMLATDLGCVAGRIVDAAGTALPRAALRYRDITNREGGLAWTDADGRYCLAVSPGRPSQLEALGIVSGGFTSVDELTLAAPPSAASCGGTSCSDAGTQTTVARRVGCVRGSLSQLGITLTAQITASNAAGSGSETTSPTTTRSAKTGDSFCLDLTQETTLAVTGTGLSCGTAKQLQLPVAAASCDEQNCVDLGVITCCTDSDYCNGGFDDDCDGRVDEGCSCNASCAEFHKTYPNATSHCCTASGACGFRYPRAAPVDHCFEFSANSRYDSTCPTAIVTIAGKQTESSGCCRSDGQCGLGFDGACLLRSEMQYLTNMSLAPQACVYP